MSVGASIGWKLRRLRSMGVREVGWRIYQATRAQLEQFGLGLAKPAAPRGTCGKPWVTELPSGFAPNLYIKSADAVLSGRWSVFAMKQANLGFPPQWNIDPKTGIRAPNGFGKFIDYRNESQVGDIKYLWEINRHLQLVTLAQAWHLSRERRYADGCRRLLESWFEQCPYPSGPNWTSSLEAGYRLVNWAIAWHLLGGDQSVLFDGQSGKEFRTRWLRSVREQSHFIAGWLSRYSSANNHLLGEYMGLLVAAITWPLWPESEGWLCAAHDGFESEVMLQNAPDGVNLEQAIYYQHEVMDMILTCALFGRHNGIDFSAPFWDRFEKMCEFVAAMMDRSGNLPMIGDSDDALIARWNPEEFFNPYRSLLATGAILFNRGDWKRKAGCCDDKTRWLLGDSADQAFAAVASGDSAESRNAFPVGGYYVLGGRYGRPDEVLLVVDCGPIGYGSIAAHGHADALSLCLSLGGVQFLIDPGTYAYHTDKVWREYFRSTRAHNTVCIDGVDQSISGGSFLWRQKANAHREQFAANSERQLFVGMHDGYERLADPVTHFRQVSLELAANRIVVKDEFRCKELHRFEVCWHFSERCVVSVEGSTVLAAADGRRMAMTATSRQGATLELLRGNERPPAGWISRSYDVRVPTATAVWCMSGDAPASITTVIDFGGVDDAGAEKSGHLRVRRS